MLEEVDWILPTELDTNKNANDHTKNFGRNTKRTSIQESTPTKRHYVLAVFQTRLPMQPCQIFAETVQERKEERHLWQW